MARIAFVTWDGGGNVPPAAAIARELTHRGHTAVFLGYEVQRRSIEARGFEFLPLPRTGGFDIYASDDPRMRMGGLMDRVWAARDHLGDVAEAYTASGADVAVVDFLMQGALAAAAQHRIPHVVLAHSVVAGLVPPPESPVGAARIAAANTVRTEAGLAALHRLDDAWRDRPTIVTALAMLDAAASTAGASTVYVGPVAEPAPASAWESPWPPDDDRPLVVVSFTTTRLWDQSGRIHNTLEALEYERVRVLVCGSHAVDRAHIPANATLRTFVPHSSVLPGASATVTHAGHGTVSASLRFGVPLVALPNPVADQPYLAATVERLGAGRALDGDAPPDAIRAAVTEVLAEARFGAAAAHVAGAIRSAAGAAGAALEVERVAGVVRESAVTGTSP